VAKEQTMRGSVEQEMHPLQVRVASPGGGWREGA
jgi:hypothetical protein